jgi:hypothetical protein
MESSPVDVRMCFSSSSRFPDCRSDIVKDDTLYVSRDAAVAVAVAVAVVAEADTFGARWNKNVPLKMILATKAMIVWPDTYFIFVSSIF